MKGLFKAGGVALILGLLLFASRSQSEPQKPQAPKMRIGVINLGYVLKNYKKVDTYTSEMKAKFTEFDQALKVLKGDMEKLTKKSQDKELSDEERQNVQQDLKQLQRELEDKNEKMKAMISKKTDQQMVTIYSDIRGAAERYAKRTIWSWCCTTLMR